MSDRTEEVSPILRRRQVEALSGLSRSAIYGKTNPNDRNYDPTFPKPIKLGARSVGWVKSEVLGWIQSRIDASRGN